MSIWVKICGNTSIEDALLAANAGADALGFIFTASPRQVSVAQAASICTQLPGPIEKIGVFVDAGFNEIAATVEACVLTGVQLHFGASPDLPHQLRGRFGDGLRILRVVHFDVGASADAVAAEVAVLQGDAALDGILVDSRTATARGGTGIAFDWAAARETVFGRSTALRMIAAGGLRPGNVAQAIATLRPWGVDVVSGVESAPGRKAPDKVRAFVAAARGAGLRTEQP